MNRKGWDVLPPQSLDSLLGIELCFKLSVSHFAVVQIWCYGIMPRLAQNFLNGLADLITNAILFYIFRAQVFILIKVVALVSV